MSRRCVLVETGSGQRGRIWSDPWLAARVESVDQYALKDLNWRRYAGLIVTMHADQRWFASLAHLVEPYLAADGAIAFNGHIAYPFLPELRSFVPMESTHFSNLAVKQVRPHPVFANLDPALMNCRRGVVGFWGRGHNPTPEGAVVLQTLGQGTIPVDWILHRPGGGRLLVHSGNDLWTNFQSNGDNLRIARQLVAWLCDADAGPGAI